MQGAVDAARKALGLPTGGRGGDSCSTANTRGLSFLICKMKDLEKVISKVPQAKKKKKKLYNSLGYWPSSYRIHTGELFQ